MVAGGVLNRAKKEKNDDFYTQLSVIEDELKHYKEHFRDKIIYCNCDDPEISNFYKYFSMNFEELGLKKLITTCYKNQKSEIFSNESDEKSIWLECEHGKYENGAYIPEKPTIRHLCGDGDFRSEECIELLKQSDIVVTNPPFSLFREFLGQLIEFDKKFLILGNGNSVGTKNIFPLVQNQKIWFGIDNKKSKTYEVPADYNVGKTPPKIIDGKRYVTLGNTRWYTNLDHMKRHEDLILFRKYSPTEHPKYDNFDAISVDHIVDIPRDYGGLIGVPLSFLDKHNPDQFEIVGSDEQLIKELTGSANRFYVNGERKFARIVIRNKEL